MGKGGAEGRPLLLQHHSCCCCSHYCHSHCSCCHPAPAPVPAVVVVMLPLSAFIHACPTVCLSRPRLCSFGFRSHSFGLICTPQPLVCVCIKYMVGTYILYRLTFIPCITCGSGPLLWMAGYSSLQVGYKLLV